MPLIEPDFSESQDTVGAGTYQCRIKDAKLGEWAAKEAGKSSIKYVNWTLETFNETEPKNNGRYIFHKTSYTGRVTRPLKDLYVAAIGQTLDETSPKFNTDQVLGREVEVTVGPGRDPQYMEVKSVRSLRS